MAREFYSHPSRKNKDAARVGHPVLCNYHASEAQDGEIQVDAGLLFIRFNR
jgi:hypothetical protein